MYRQVTFCIAVFLALAWAGAIDLEDYRQQHDRYCENVFELSIWPDYKNVGPEGCGR